MCNVPQAISVFEECIEHHSIHTQANNTETVCGPFPYNVYVPQAIPVFEESN